MESFLSDKWDVKAKHTSEEALQRWRELCGVVKNPKRRFRFTANLTKRYEAAAMRKTNQEKLRIAVLVSKAAFQFIQDEVQAAGFQICADELESIVEGHDVKKLKFHGGVSGIADKLGANCTDGLSTDGEALNRRREIYGINKFQESEPQSFWTFVWEALHDMTLVILGVCAIVSLIVGILTEGWPKGAHDGLGIVASILLVVLVTATSDYRQSLQFRDLDKEKKKISVQVTRNGYRKKMSMYHLLPGDIVHLSIGDQVPADGLFLSGFSVLIDESSLTGESEPVMITADNPFLLSGTKVQDGSCKMLVTTVGMRTQWGKLMATLSEGGDDETPLQVKLNGVATIIGKIGLFFAVVTFAVLVQKIISRKWQEGTTTKWSGDDALELLEYFAIAVTIVVVAVPEGLPLAVTLSLAFAMKKMMNDKALVRHLAACERLEQLDDASTLALNSTSVVKILLQSIFNNTGGEVVAERQPCKVVKVEPFNSTKKRMGVVLELPEGVVRAHTKGASEIVLAACDKVINSDGEVVPLEEAAINHLTKTIEQLASEALRTLCLAYMDLENGFSADNEIPSSGFTCIGIVGIKESGYVLVLGVCCALQSAGVTVRMKVQFSQARLGGTDELIPKIQVMARSSPLDKHTLVKHLRTTFDEVVAVTGDGTNDAPALHEADIGLAMGISGTEVAKESADVIILDDNFSTIVTVAKWGRSVYVNIQKFVQFQLTVNVVALTVNFYSACRTGSAPLTAVQLLWVNMIMDTLGALALATEPPTDELMKRAPVGRKGNFISAVMWRNILGQSLFQFIVILFLQAYGKSFFRLHGCPDSDLVLNTIIFNTFVFCQLFNEVNSREMEKIDVLDGILDNNVFVMVVGSTFFFQIIIIEYLGTFASTTPLTVFQWLVCIIIGFLGMPIAVVLKKHVPVQT
ncbi:Calcium-transporting ATPase 2, plasma membrane-type [Sesamum alatum]|uniref:P-type Ca(2+) transporter n=1 Tax=Sesamum alatum TaxID=300844 RepID=A0AAE2CBW4_9LAMI|nr:Calcium-transporting ATPase 2, plasma membrane-type [Sesamum alatum]